jgi:hypothetical protein
MRKLIFIIAFLLVSSPLKADWEFLVSNIHGTNVYIDEERIERGLIRKNYIYYWILTNYGNADPFKKKWKGPINSSLSKYVIDCKTNSFRFLEFIYFSENFAKGKKNNVSGIPSEWRNSDSVSIEESNLLKIICNKG